MPKSLPPPFRKMLETHKNKRKSKFDEERDGKKKDFVERDFMQNKCENCGRLDHCRKTYMNSPKSNEASTSATLFKRGRQKKHPGTTLQTTSSPYDNSNHNQSP